MKTDFPTHICIAWFDIIVDDRSVFITARIVSDDHIPRSFWHESEASQRWQGTKGRLKRKTRSIRRFFSPVFP